MSQFHLGFHCTCIEPVPNCRAMKTSWLAWPVPSLSLNVWLWDKRNQIFVSIRQGSPLSISQSQRQRQVQSSCSWLSELMWMQAFTLSRTAGKILIVSAQRKAKLDLSTHKTHACWNSGTPCIFSRYLLGWFQGFSIVLSLGPFMNSLPETNCSCTFCQLWLVNEST